MNVEPASVSLRTVIDFPLFLCVAEFGDTRRLRREHARTADPRIQQTADSECVVAQQLSGQAQAVLAREEFVFGIGFR